MISMKQPTKHAQLPSAHLDLILAVDAASLLCFWRMVMCFTRIKHHAASVRVLLMKSRTLCTFPGNRSFHPKTFWAKI